METNQHCESGKPVKNGYLNRLTTAASRRFVLQSEEAPIHVTLNISCDQGQTQPTGDKR